MFFRTFKMDHLPASSHYTPFEVPYIFDQSRPFVYDNGDWPGYLGRQGFTLQDFQEETTRRTHATAKLTPKQAASLTQAWLYFGLIHCITRVPVETSKFLRYNDNGQQVITTAYLAEHIENWRNLIAQWSETDKEEYITGVDNIIGILEHFYITVVGFDSKVVPSEVSFSMVIMLKTLICVKTSFFPGSMVPRESWYGDYKKVLKTNLHNNGWCKADIFRFFQFASSLMIYHLSTQDPYPSTRDHSSCSEIECHALQSTEVGYKQRHITSECSCPLIGLEEQQLDTVIMEGCIPGLTFDDETGLSVHPIVAGGKQEIESYVAISHVWADGLGNPSRNSMYRCQLKKLQRRVNAVMSRHRGDPNVSPRSAYFPFWVDTLCVPANKGPAKTKAIASMAAIYQTATLVLVLDSNLETVPSALPVLEKAICIMSSIWWTRLWTMQEGAFAKQLYFQFRGDAVTVSDLCENQNLGMGQYAELSQIISDFLLSDTVSAFSGLALDKIRSEQGRYILRTIGHRFCTHAKDEPICLSTLLGLDITAIYESSNEAKGRMKKFVLLQAHFPTALLFMGDYKPRAIDEDGFRWVPETFVSRRSFGISSYKLRDPNRQYHAVPGLPDSALADKFGLHIQSFGFSLELYSNVDTTSSNPYGTRILNERDGYSYKIQLNKICSQYTWDYLKQLNAPKIILPRPLDPSTRVLFGVLVTVLEEVDSELFCRYHVQIMASWNGAAGPADEWERLNGCGRVYSLDVDQKWCVG